jgi:hypothetical protein
MVEKRFAESVIIAATYEHDLYLLAQVEPKIPRNPTYNIGEINRSIEIQRGPRVNRKPRAILGRYLREVNPLSG